MLETDEVDIDYFTPAGSTSLASIFGKSSVGEDPKDTPSLKYAPPPPPEKTKSDEAKPTQWIFTCTVHGFEWINSEYISRGKLGLAILKIFKTNSHSIIIYDSNKTTLSFVTISPKLNIHTGDALTISYYDNAQKYWSIKTSENDINKILELLKDLQATIVTKSSQETDKEQPNDSDLQNKDAVAIKKGEEPKDETEVDTDFYMNQKTKDSILKRMANMGHSVLSLHGNAKERTSDSSDSNNIEESKKNIRHKPKLPPKKSMDLNIQEKLSSTTDCSRSFINRTHMDGQALVHPKIPCGGDMNIFISEQKISNSELRINVNRVSDKIDVVLERLNDIINVDKRNSFSYCQNDIVQKLLKEYESKIKYYEYIMNSKGVDFHTMELQGTHLNESVSNSYINEGQTYKIDELETQSAKKDVIIRELEKEIEVIKEKSNKADEENQEKINELLTKIETLSETLHLKNEEVDSIKNNSNKIHVNNQEICDTASKVKKIMNDTFEAISVNFDNTEAYSGDTIKAIIAKVIKKTTIQALQDL